MIKLNLLQADESVQFRSKPFSLQETFSTPLQDLPRFISTFLSSFDPRIGFLSTDEVVFEPKNLLALAMRYEIRIKDEWEWDLTAEGRDHLVDLLEAALGDWIDFLFIPVPQSFAIYADHDEFTTFYFKGKATQSLVTSRLCEAGFKHINGYARPIDYMARRK